MAENIMLEVVTPERIVVSEQVQIVAAPGSLGEFGVLVGHTPFLTSLKTGVLRYTDAQGTERYVFVSGGFAEALPDKVTVLAESAEKQDEIDLERAKAAKQRAEKRLSEDRDRQQVDIARARAALDRAVTRMNLVQLH